MRIISFLDWAYCQRFECCTPAWTRHDPYNMDFTLHNKLFGQHLVVDIVSKAIRNHVFNDSPKKALVLSFHGSTGTGKNYVSNIITNNLYLMGSRSKFVLKKISWQDYPHASEIWKYKINLKALIEKQTRKCERSLFIFDEMHKMPKGLLNVVRNLLHGGFLIDYRKNIFIFLSNLGSEEINIETYHHLKSGEKREGITKKQMKNVILKALYKESDSFNSVLRLGGLIDFFVPFLPLEREHVKHCIEKSIKEHRKRKPKDKGKPVTEHLKERVANELQYSQKFEEMFSDSGCKRVDKKIGLFI